MSSRVVAIHGSDTPQEDPVNDAFNYAPFAKLIAKAVCTTPEPHGLVMAIHGPWGAGKSTALNFIKHFIKETDSKILTVDFNPWWFNDKDHLATQFMKEFEKKLKIAPGKIRAVGKLMGTYADGLATMATTSAGAPFLSKPVAAILKFLGRDDPKDIPRIKKKISTALQQSDQRVLFLVDDIDRLTPEEICEVFKVIKALADFPNVIYIVSFDKDIVSNALTQSLGVDGGGYLEKIVQAQFSLPIIDQDLLRQAFFDELSQLADRFPPAKFDSEYWQNTFIEGIEGYLKRPRDIVRLANSLRTTYPPLSKEVNLVDFVSIEVLRIFEPIAYRTVRDNRSEFTGHRDQNRDPGDRNRVFHENWLASIPLGNRQRVVKLLSNVFPKFASSFGEAGHGAEWVGNWRNNLRICTDDHFATYFGFSMSPNVVSRTDLMNFIERAKGGGNLVDTLLEADKITSKTNSRQSKEYLLKIRQLEDELNTDAAVNILRCLYTVGDQLLDYPEEDVGLAALPRHWLLLSTIDHLLSYVDQTDRHRILRENFTNGQAIGLATMTANRIRNHLEKPDRAPNSSLATFTEVDFNEFKAIIYDRIRTIDGPIFLDMADLKTVMFILASWGYEEEIRRMITPLFLNTYLLPRALDRFMHVGHSYVMGRPAVSRSVSLSPKTNAPLIDVQAVEPAIQTMLLRHDISFDQRAAGESFLSGMEKLRNGIDPDEGDA